MGVSPPGSPKPVNPVQPSSASKSSGSSSESSERSRSPFPTRIETFTGPTSHPYDRISRIGGGGCLDCTF